ncbi:hypothetical protein BGZ60DRAFT_469878 [Tricladium varicosporioides]|nr:hypothetical protein BGZ60DRAFT_469878 [Hymenoscyphus varicosporioides]
MASNFYLDGTPDNIKNAKGLHMITMSAPNGKEVLIIHEELKLKHRRDCRIWVLIDNTKTPPFPVMETSAELLYLLKVFDKEDAFGFKDELECTIIPNRQGAPIEGQLNWFGEMAPEKNEMALTRFKNEVLQVFFEVLEIHLSGNKGRYSVADIGTWHQDMKQFPHVLNWLARIGENGCDKKYKFW